MSDHPAREATTWPRRLLTAAGVATAIAGVVAGIRQRREAMAIRRGALPAVGPIRVDPPAAAQGRLAAAVGSWTPAAPRTTGGRIAASCWAAPMTAVGLLVGMASGGRPRWDTEHQCIVFEGASTGSALLLKAVGASANTIGQVVISRPDPASPNLLAHEAGHVRQAERLGLLLLPTYLWFGARYGYRDNPVERAARQYASQWKAQRRAE